MKIGFYTLGCKVNQFETQALAQLAAARGYERVESDADVFLINTCTVTSVSEQKNLRAIRRIRRENPNAVIAACGCFAQTSPERLSALPEIDLVCGTTERAKIFDRCEAELRERTHAQYVRPLRTAHDLFEMLPAGVLPGHTRALLKVQDGCDNYCSYCIIPYARGHIRSLPPALAVTQAQALAAMGAKEVILTGIEISSYGRDLEDKPTLAALVDSLCQSAPKVRFRLGSLEPRTVTEEFCRTLAKHQNLAHHFHLSLQSGCDATLKRMNRKYTTQEYADRVELLRRFFPNCSVTTDLITGFPQETEGEFQTTLAFLQRIRFASVHVFPYSEREGTPAAQMEQLPVSVRTQRADTARRLAAALSEEFLRGFVGKTVPVLLERSHAEFQPAHSKWHFAVHLPPESGAQGSIQHARLTGVQDGVLLGTIE